MFSVCFFLVSSPHKVRKSSSSSCGRTFRSLGVLLYTLVYGAMPFDGSNFKRLVKQISSGEYYEPPDKPSSIHSPPFEYKVLLK